MPDQGSKPDQGPKPDQTDSQRPQERDFTIDQWDKFPFKKKDDPYENRKDDKAPARSGSQYEYEGWEHSAFPNEDVSEKPAEPGDESAAGTKDKTPPQKGSS